MLISLGPFVFATETAPYNEIQHQTEQRWAAVDRLGVRPAYQHLGPGTETMTFPGTLCPEITGGPSHLRQLRQMQSAGQAYLMVSQDGLVHGAWIITSINDTQSIFLPTGQALNIEFSISLIRVDDDRVDLIGDLVDDLAVDQTQAFV